MNKGQAFQGVLIANRGVIAQRIARTCLELDLQVLMVAAPNDQHLPWLSAADHIVFCDYTDSAKLIAFAKEHQAAIHPGYGFLAENAAFAAHCHQADVPWIGPSPEVLARAGHKAHCQTYLQQHGIRCLPHVALHQNASWDASTLAQQLEQAGIGFPCLVKPSTGGGGLGMIWVEGPEALQEAVTQAQESGLKIYHCGDIFIEKALPSARHIEVQILADATGACCIVGDRDCSLQRRRQKIIEEGPSALETITRKRLYAEAIQIAQCLNLNQVSTLEFLWDGNHFWFLEANPRLQVEHAVSEMLTGLDLVACQIANTQGFPLTEILSQQQRSLPLLTQGHAIEARLYAESPETGLPTTGHILDLHLPTGHGIRVESCVYRDMPVSAHYDGLLMKIIAHGPTREHSRRRLLQALNTLVIQGDGNLHTNQARLLHVLAHPHFIAGHYHTRSTTAHWQAPEASSTLQGLHKALEKSLPFPENPTPHIAPTYQSWRPFHW